MAPKPVTFHSRYTEYEIIRRPRIQTPLPMGGGWQTVGEPRISFEFHAAPSPDGTHLIGVCHVLPGRNKLVDGDGWLAAGMEQKERDDVEALRAHSAFGRDFWEAGHEPGTLYPRPVDFRADLVSASVALDEEAILELIGAEEKSHVRRELLDEAKVALDQVRSARAQIEAAQAEADAEAEKKTPKAKAAA